MPSMNDLYMRNADLFLDENRRLIMSMANKTFGVGHYNPDEIMSAAFMAYYHYSQGKRDSMKRSTRTTVFTNYLRKEFGNLVPLQCCEMQGHTPSATADHEPDPDAIACNMPEYWQNEMIMATEEEQSEGEEPSLEVGAAFIVCARSFREKNVSEQLAHALLLLSRRSNSLQKTMTALACSNTRVLKQRVLALLKKEVYGRGYKTFKGECINGKRSLVVVCAENHDDAQRYLSAYGKVICCSEMTGKSS